MRQLIVRVLCFVLVGAIVIASESHMKQELEELTKRMSHPSLYTSSVDTAPEDRMATMRRVISSLPAEELRTLGLELNADGSFGASDERLEELWIERQQQLKEVFQDSVKPKEHLATVIEQLQTETDTDNLVYILNLEDLLTDIDMAQDFHRLGHWPVLTSLIGTSHHARVRAAAAWTIGTAVKNTYDNQLWVLEKQTSTGNTVLHDLRAMLHDTFDGTERSEAAQKAMYAISAASRGNPEVQAVLKDTGAAKELQSVLDGCDASDEVLKNKVWRFVQDLIAERVYVLDTLVPDDVIAQEMREALVNMKLLGDDFVNDEWLRRAMQQLKVVSESAAAEEMTPNTRQLLDSVVDVVKMIVRLKPTIVEDPVSISDVLGLFEQNGASVLGRFVALPSVESFLGQSSA